MNRAQARGGNLNRLKSQRRQTSHCTIREFHPVLSSRTCIFSCAVLLEESFRTSTDNWWKPGRSTLRKSACISAYNNGSSKWWTILKSTHLTWNSSCRDGHWWSDGFTVKPSEECFFCQWWTFSSSLRLIPNTFTGPRSQRTLRRASMSS